MNRLQHFLRAKTMYGLHSPFVYRLYTEVLFSRARRRGQGFADVVWRLERYYGVGAMVEGPQATLDCRDGRLVVLDHPHRQEQQWQQLVSDPRHRVTLDLYTVGIAVDNPRLSRQHFLLR